MKPRKEPWRANNEMHYCKFCNVWIQGDKQSILIHENGKKHKENVELAMKKRREDKLKSEKDKKAFEASMRKIEQAAALAHSRDVDLGHVSVHNSSLKASSSGFNTIHSGNDNQGSIKSEMKSWKQKKQQREIEKNDSKNETADDALYQSTSSTTATAAKKKISLGPNEGHYSIDDTIYLEGKVYAPIFEEEMPVQLWTGSSTMSNDYRKSKDSQSLWKDGLILKVSKKRILDGKNSQDEDEVNISCAVAYLKDINDEDETIQKNVQPVDLRLIIGSDDEWIPNTIEEARLVLLGGEEIVNSNNEHSLATDQAPAIDDNTGLSSWGTVAVRKVSVNHELKQERERLRRKRREEAEKERLKEKEIAYRKMEESKHEGEHDSALGAYDVWSTSEKIGYKGIKIHDTNNLETTNTISSSETNGEERSQDKSSVKFKKRGGDKKLSFKAKKRKQNRRITFTEEEDDG